MKKYLDQSSLLLPLRLCAFARDKFISGFSNTQKLPQNQLNQLAGKIKAFKDIDPVVWQQQIRSEWDETRLPKLSQDCLPKD